MRGVLGEGSGLVGEGEHPGGAKASGEQRLCLGLNRRCRVSDLRVEQPPEVGGVSPGFVNVGLAHDAVLASCRFETRFPTWPGTRLTARGDVGWRQSSPARWEKALERKTPRADLA
jgi:hypothetical protein